LDFERGYLSLVKIFLKMRMNLVDLFCGFAGPLFTFTADGGRFWTLTILDVFARESLAI
jgi:hypothetical protein